MTNEDIGLSPELIALRISRELRDGMVVNLGAGIGMLLCEFTYPDIDVLFHAEHGVIGYGPTATPGGTFYDPHNWVMGSLKELQPGASIVDHAESFAIARGGRLDLAVLGGFQVSAHGDLANWWMPSMVAGCPGGAPDIACGAKRVIVAMAHLTHDGQPRLVDECTYPVTAIRCVDTVVTTYGVFSPTTEGLVVNEIVAGMDIDQLQRLTATKLIPSPNLGIVQL